MAGNGSLASTEATLCGSVPPLFGRLGMFDECVPAREGERGGEGARATHPSSGAVLRHKGAAEPAGLALSLAPNLGACLSTSYWRN